MPERQLKYGYWIVLALASLAFLSGINLPILGVDAPQYAAMSMEMSETGNYLQVMHRGHDYLDKPPLLFWLSSFSFSVFGLESWAYRLPSLLFVFLGIYSTMRLGRLLYGKSAGYLAGMIFATTQAVFLMTHDVRTDTILVSAVVFALWGIIEFLEKGKWKFLILGFVGIGIAMLCKGPIGLMVPVLALSTHFIIRKQWQNFVRWEWLVGLIIVAIVISPMVYGLYQQFDAHPEKKTVLSSGRIVEGISGLKFYFWEQSFGRLTGESEWNNNPQWHFFLGIFSWTFLPWTFLAILGLVHKFRTGFKAIAVSEFYTLGAIILPFIALSLSRFQLDHYIYVIYPFMAIITASYLVHLQSLNRGRFIVWVQAFVKLIMISGIIMVGKYVFPQVNFLYWIILALLLLLLAGSIIRRKTIFISILTSAAAACLLNVFIKVHFFGNLAAYEGMISAAQLTNELGIPKDQQFTLNIPPHVYDFYTKSTTTYHSGLNTDKPEVLRGRSYIMSEEDFLKYNVIALDPLRIEKFKNYPTTLLNTKFLNQATREQELNYIYLVIF